MILVQRNGLVLVCSVTRWSCLSMWVVCPCIDWFKCCWRKSPLNHNKHNHQLLL